MQPRLRERPVVQATLAVVAGLTTWLTGHTLTHLVWDQLQHTAEPTVPVENAVATIGIAFLAVALAGLGFAHRSDGGSIPRWVTGRWLGLLGPLVFVGAEFAAHLGEDHGAPPLALLVLGTVVHAAVGALAPSALVAAFTGMSAAVRALCGAFESPDDTAVAAIAGATRVWSSTFAKACWESRGPPRGSVSMFVPLRPVAL